MARTPRDRACRLGCRVGGELIAKLLVDFRPVVPAAEEPDSDRNRQVEPLGDGANAADFAVGHEAGEGELDGLCGFESTIPMAPVGVEERSRIRLVPVHQQERGDGRRIESIGLETCGLLSRALS